MAATCPATFDVALLRTRIREMYARLATAPHGTFHFHRGPAYASTLLGYPADELATLPCEATEAFAGVGRPFAAGMLAPGEVVLDHACGAGMDLLLAARQVGPSGRAIGVDLTPAMVARATRAVAAAGLADRVEILQGAYEALPVPTGSVDAVISNGVLNLAPDKPVVLREIMRVLRPGGRLMLADVVVQRELTLAAREDPELWAACIAGALPERELVELVDAAGFVDVHIVERFDCFRGTSAARKTSPDLRIGAVALAARRPASTDHSLTTRNTDMTTTTTPTTSDATPPRRPRPPRNGVDTPTLLATIEAVGKQPELAQFKFRAVNRWIAGTHSQTRMASFFGAGSEHVHRTSVAYDADHPTVLVGTDQGPTPVEFLLHALAACLTAGIANIAAARGVTLTEVESTVEGDIDLQGILGLSDRVRNGFERIRACFKIRGDASADKLREVIEQSRARSAVFDVITNRVPVELTIDAA